MCNFSFPFRNIRIAPEDAPEEDLASIYHAKKMQKEIEQQKKRQTTDQKPSSLCKFQISFYKKKCNGLVEGFLLSQLIYMQHSFVFQCL